jgi:hypothetical protein
MAAVLTRDIVKKFGDVLAVNGISLTVADGEFMVLLGPSGCRSATTLPFRCAPSACLASRSTRRWRGLHNCSASTIYSTAGRVSSRAASASGLHSRALWCASRPLCCSTSRSRISTPNCAPHLRLLTPSLA